MQNDPEPRPEDSADSAEPFDVVSEDALVGVFSRMTFQRSARFADLSDALAAAQLEYPVVPKNKTARVVSRKPGGASYEYNYADLAGCLAAIRPPLNRQGISVTFGGAFTKEDYVSSCLLTKRDQWLLVVVPLPLPPDETIRPQDIGTLKTFGKRYAFQDAAGFFSEDDTDAQEIEGRKRSESKTHQQSQRESREPQNWEPPAEASAEHGKVIDSLRELEAVFMRHDAINLFRAKLAAFQVNSVEELAGDVQKVTQAKAVALLKVLQRLAGDLPPTPQSQPRPETPTEAAASVRDARPRDDRSDAQAAVDDMAGHPYVATESDLPPILRQPDEPKFLLRTDFSDDEWEQLIAAIKWVRDVNDAKAARMVLSSQKTKAEFIDAVRKQQAEKRAKQAADKGASK